jgi:hypothetical protein
MLGAISMGFLTQIHMKFVDGINSYKSGDIVSIDIDDSANEIVIKGFLNRKAPIVHLPISKVTYVSLDTEQEEIEKNKSVVGRAVAGSLIAGPLGAVIGGMSGIGTKKKKGKERVILTIGYTDGELVFIENKDITITNFYERLRKRLPFNGVEDNNEHIRL